MSASLPNFIEWIAPFLGRITRKAVLTRINREANWRCKQVIIKTINVSASPKYWAMQELLIEMADISSRPGSVIPWVHANCKGNFVSFSQYKKVDHCASTFLHSAFASNAKKSLYETVYWACSLPKKLSACDACIYGAIVGGHEDLLAWIHAKYGPKRTTWPSNDICLLAIKYNQPAIFIKEYKKNAENIVIESCINAIIQTENTVLLDYLLRVRKCAVHPRRGACIDSEHYYVNISRQQITNILTKGSLPLIKVLKARNVLCLTCNDHMITAIRCNHPEIVQYFADITAVLTRACLEHALGVGNLRIMGVLSLAYQQRQIDIAFTSDLYLFAAKKLASLEWLYSRGIMPLVSDAPMICKYALQARPEVLEWFESRGICDYSCLDNGKICGISLPSFDWLHAKQYKFTQMHLDDAIITQRYNLAIRMILNDNVPITSSLMHFADMNITSIDLYDAINRKGHWSENEWIDLISRLPTVTMMNGIQAMLSKK